MKYGISRFVIWGHFSMYWASFVLCLTPIILRRWSIVKKQIGDKCLFFKSELVSKTLSTSNQGL